VISQFQLFRRDSRSWRRYGGLSTPFSTCSVKKFSGFTCKQYARDNHRFILSPLLYILALYCNTVSEKMKSLKIMRLSNTAIIECIKMYLNAFRAQCFYCSDQIQSSHQCIKWYLQIDYSLTHCFIGHFATSHQCFTHWSSQRCCGSLWILWSDWPGDIYAFGFDGFCCDWVSEEALL